MKTKIGLFFLFIISSKNFKKLPKKSQVGWNHSLKNFKISSWLRLTTSSFTFLRSELALKFDRLDPTYQTAKARERRFHNQKIDFWSRISHIRFFVIKIKKTEDMFRRSYIVGYWKKESILLTICTWMKDAAKLIKAGWVFSIKITLYEAKSQVGLDERGLAPGKVLFFYI